MAILGVLLTAVALGIGVKSRHVRRGLYHKDDHALVGDTLQQVETSYQGEVLAPVSTAAVVFWNAGTETIDGNDVAAADPLRIDIPEDGHVLQVRVSARTREANQSDIIIESPTSVRLTFDFLDPGDGMRVRMLYKGQPGGVAFGGTIKGMPQGLQAVADGELVGLVKPLRLLYLSMAGLLAATIPLALVGNLSQGQPWTIVLLGFGVLAAVGAISTTPRGAWQRRFRVPDELAPWQEVR